MGRLLTCGSMAILCARAVNVGGAVIAEDSVTVFNRSLRRPGALIAVAAAGVLGVGLSAGTAAAHTPNWSVDCSSVTINLKAYGHGNSPVNEVSLTADGTSLVSEKFGDSFSKKLDLAKHSKEVSLHLVVKAADGDKYNVDETKTSPVCPGDEEPTPTPSTTPPSTPPAEETPTPTPSTTASTPEVEPTSSSPAADVPSSQPSPAGDNLAETGSSSSTPIIAGAAAVVLVAGAGIMWASRKRRASQG